MPEREYRRDPVGGTALLVAGLAVMVAMVAARLAGRVSSGLLIAVVAGGALAVAGMRRLDPYGLSKPVAPVEVPAGQPRPELPERLYTRGRQMGLTAHTEPYMLLVDGLVLVPVSPLAFAGIVHLSRARGDVPGWFVPAMGAIIATLFLIGIVFLHLSWVTAAWMKSYRALTGHWPSE